VVQIDVSKNHVRSVKKNFYRPPIELDVSDNRLKKLPAAKSKKKNCIHAINVSRNGLTKLPTNINNLACMTRLDLSNNSLQEVCCRHVDCVCLMQRDDDDTQFGLVSFQNVKYSCFIEH